MELDRLIKEARSQKAAEKHLQDLYELKAGDALKNSKLTELGSILDELPSKKARSERWRRTQHNSLKKFREHITDNHPSVEHMAQVTHTIAKEWMRMIEDAG